MNIVERLQHKVTDKNCMRKAKHIVCIFIFFVATQLLYWNNSRVEYSPLVIFESWGLQKNEPHFPKVHHQESSSAKVQSISLLWEPNYGPISWSDIHFISLEQRTLFGRSPLEKQFLDEISSNYDKPRVGRFFLVRNGSFEMPFDCGYNSDVKYLTVPRIPNIKFDKLLPLIIPDGWSFQHILNGTLPKLMMALDWVIINNITVVLESPRDAIFLQILQKLDITNIAW